MNTVKEVHDTLFQEHTENYQHFTRLLLTLSVGFITFTTALNNSGFSLLYKASIVAHAISILFGVWLQFINVKRPIQDLGKFMALLQEEDREQNYMPRPPSLIEQVCFHTQAIAFLAAFVLVIIKVMI